MAKIGIYPGTFDPVHPGHVAFALEARRVCGLDKVVFLPETLPRGKHDVSDIAERTALLRAAAVLDGLDVASLQSERFTVKDTMPEILGMFDGADITFLMGSDVAHTLTYRWEGLDTLFSSVSLAIGMRGEHTPEQITAIIRDLEKEYGLAIRHTILRAEHSHLASSQIRMR